MRSQRFSRVAEILAGCRSQLIKSEEEDAMWGSGHKAETLSDDPENTYHTSCCSYNSANLEDSV